MVVVLLLGFCGKGDEEKQEGTESHEATPGGKAGEVLAVVSSGGGGVTVRSADGEAHRGVKAGDTIRGGDRLEVSDRANAMIHLAGGEELALNAGTHLTVVSGTSIDLDKGELWLSSGVSEKADKLSIRTAGGNVTIEGTVADVQYAEKVLRVSVISGKAKIVGERGDFEINGGQEAILEPEKEGSVTPVRNPGILAAWTEGIRREISRTLSKDGEGEHQQPRGLGTLTARVPTGKKDLPFEILSQKVTVKIQDQIALTQVEQVFKNPTTSTVEGTYKFPIPHGARMTRYDMEIKGKMMQGEIVERKRGRVIMAQVIREFVDRMRDPALVEWESGSTFKTRIFPILPKEKKRIVLSYVQALTGEGSHYRYVLPVSTPGAPAPAVPVMNIHVDVSGSAGSPVVTTPLYPAATSAKDGKVSIDFEAKDFSPVVDFVVNVEHLERPEATLVTYGAKKKGKDADADEPMLGKPAKAGGEEAGWDYFQLSVRPEFEAADAKPQEQQHWIFLADTSVSRTAVDMEVQKRLLGAVMGSMARQDRVKTIAYDMTGRVMHEDWERPTRDYLEQVGAFLDALPPAGATNIESALLKAAEQLGTTRNTKIILIGDGAATLGENRPGELSSWAGELFNESRATVTTIGIGSSVDSLLFEELAERTGGKFNYISSGEDLLTVAVKIIGSLRTPLLQQASVSFEGLEVKDVFPERIANIASGEEVVITGRYRGTGKLEAVLTGTVAEQKFARTHSFNVGESKQSNTFVPVMWASRKIDSLTLEGGGEAEKQIVKLSRAYSLPSRFTSFIVLENAAMYDEFGVKRTKDRIEWTGEEQIEYEDSGEELEAMEAAQSRSAALDSVSSSGIMGILGADGSEGLGDMDDSSGISGISSKDAISAGAVKAGGKASAPASEKKMESAPAPAMAKKAKSPAKPKPSTQMGLADPFGGGEWDGGGGGGGGGYYYHPRVVKKATIKTLPYEMTLAQKRVKVEEMKAAIEKEPLVRDHRKRYIGFLVYVGDYKEALKETEAWYAMDSGHATVMTTMGDLLRLQGKYYDATRYYSGILDVSPEDKKVMETLAGYFERKEQWDMAYPFRVSRHLMKTTDKTAAAERAIAAARAGRWDDAGRITDELCVKSTDGSAAMKKGVKVSSDLRPLLLKVAAMEKSPLLYEQPVKGSVKSAQLVIELSWDKPVNLDLWVSRKGDYLGGGGDEGKIIDGARGTDGEVFYLSKVKNGRYTVQVSCAEEKGCGTLAGSVRIKALGKTQKIPFIMEESWGQDIASVKITEGYY
ncbi:MAG: VIT domain-containing protein [Pseudomonadota bacterium]